MKTYSTIQEAFKNGNGDVFFKQINDQFVCVSRKDPESQNELLNKGFTFMPYEEVINESLKSTSVDSAKVWLAAKTAPPVSNYSNKSNYFRNEHPDIYEFSDADPGL